MAKVLLVEDNAGIAEGIRMNLELEGHQARIAPTGEEGIKLLDRWTADLLVLDVMLPAVGGLDVLGQLRQRSDIPVILLTARSEEPDRVLGLELGADDYVVKPFSPRELVARVRTVLRRTIPRPAAERLDFGRLVVDPGQREVTVEGARVELTAREFDLLAFLLAHPGIVMTRERLLERVWGLSFPGGTRTVDVHVAQLRRKLDRPDLIKTVRGSGYKAAV